MMRSYTLIQLAVFLLLASENVYAVSYYDGVENSAFFSQLYAGANSTTMKLDGATSYQDSGSGIQGGFQGSLRVFRRFHLAGLLDYQSPVVTNASGSFLGRFEQTILYDAARTLENTTKIGLGWNLNYLDSGPRQYGFQALGGVHGWIGFRMFGLSLYARYGPVFNSGTTSTSNYCAVYGTQLALGGPNFAPKFSAFFEIQNISFTSKITGNSTQFNTSMAGLSVRL